MPVPPFDPISLTALGVATGAFGLQSATAGRRFYRDSKKDKVGRDSSAQYAAENRHINAATTNTGQVLTLPDGTVFSRGFTAGDTTFTTISSTRVVSLGNGKAANSVHAVSGLLNQANAASNQSNDLLPLLLMQQMHNQHQPQPQRYLAAQHHEQQQRLGIVLEDEGRPPAYQQSERVNFDQRSYQQRH